MTYAVSTSLRLRSRVSDAAVRDQLAGKILGAADYDVLLTGPTRISKPDGTPLCIYLPGALAAHSQDASTYEILHALKSLVTANRGLASGTKRINYAREGSRPSRSKAMNVPSALAGAVDHVGDRHYCRLTAWTGEHLPQWRAPT